MFGVRNITRALTRFAKAKRGATAVEFGLVLVPFAMLTAGVAEVGMIGYAQSSLDYAVNETARQIRTGQAQLGGLNQQDIKNLMCGEMSNLVVVDCAAGLYLDVRRFDSFVEASNLQSPLQNQQFDPSGFSYQPGTGSDIVVVRAFYRWTPMTPMFENLFKNTTDGDRIMASSMMFRNEPFE